MTAQVPRERRVGTIPFVANQFGNDLFGPNGGLPLSVYEYFVLRLSGTLTISVATAGALVPEQPRTLIKAVQVVVTGLTGDTFIDIPLTDLVVLSEFVANRPGASPQETPVSANTVAAYPFSGEYYLPFSLEDMANPYRGFFAANRYAQVRLRIQWGNTTDIVATGGATVVLTNTQVDVFVREFSFEPRFETAQDLLLHQRVSVLRTSVNAIAQIGLDIEIPRTASYLRGILFKQYTDSPEVPITTLLTPTSQVTLLYNDTDRKYETTLSQLLGENKRNYMRTGTFPTGYAFLDLSPDGDFSLLQNMLNLQKIVLRLDTASVANAFIRTTLVKYAQSA
jgi:hypothetical protein